MSLVKDLLGDNTDRRRDPRYPCHLAAVIEAEQGQLECEILSLSASGLSARCQGRLEKGQQVRLALPAQQPVLCRVEWGSRASSDNLVRLSLQQPLEGTWWAAQLEGLAQWARESRQRRGAVRVNCQIPATMSWPDGQQHQVTVLNLGTTGARLRSQSEGPLPEQLLLSFGPLGQLPAILVEVKPVHQDDDGDHGVAFSSFQAGSQRDLLDYLNHLFEPRRSRPEQP